MAKNSPYTKEISTLNASTVAIINKLKNHDKRADIATARKQLIKSNSMQELAKKDT